MEHRAPGSRRRPVRLLFAVIIVILSAAPLFAVVPRQPALRHVTLDLPGVPAALIPTDLNDDGLPDLLVPLVYTEYEEAAFERLDGMVQVTEVVPTLFDRRELWAWLARPDGAFESVGSPLPLPASVHSIEAGPPGFPAVALTDEGVWTVRLAGTPPSLGWEPLIADRTALAGGGSFVPGLEIVRDLDGEGGVDILLPARAGPAIYRRDGPGFASQPSARLVMPGDDQGIGTVVWRQYPIPRVQDVDGDHKPDLVLTRHGRQGEEIVILRGAGEGRFEPERTLSLGCLTAEGDTPELNYFGDLDGDGRAEVVTTEEKHQDDDGMKEAKTPHHIFRIHHLRDDLTIEPKPRREFEVVGYPFSVEWPEISSSGFKDLDGDGRQDLVTVTLDFSIMQIVRVLATKRISIGLTFHVWAQQGDGSFKEIEGQDLSEKLLLDLNNLKLGRLAQFNGDFDGDGRIDFVHLGRGKTVTIHLGQIGCRYAKKADMAIDLEEEPQDLALVQIRDLDGDGRSDLAVTRPLESGGSGASAPVRLELYLSREMR